MASISVIMPVYNSENYVSEAIESVLSQTYSNFEFIIINDGSTDRSAEIIKSYIGDKRIVFINREINKKLVFSLNEGLQMAKGDFIVRMDADDISHPKRFEIQLQYLLKNTDIVLVGTSYNSFNENGFIRCNVHPKNPVEIAYRFMRNTHFCHPSVMFRSKLIQEFGGYENVEAEDYRFFSKIVLKYPCTNIELALLNYREHNSNRSLTHKSQLETSVEQTARNNISFYILSNKRRTIYFDYRFKSNSKFNHIFAYLFLDIMVVCKISKKYKRPIYIFYSLLLISKILKQNLINLLKKI